MSRPPPPGPPRPMPAEAAQPPATGRARGGRGSAPVAGQPPPPGLPPPRPPGAAATGRAGRPPAPPPSGPGAGRSRGLPQALSPLSGATGSTASSESSRTRPGPPPQMGRAIVRGAVTDEEMRRLATGVSRSSVSSGTTMEQSVKTQSAGSGGGSGGAGSAGRGVPRGRGVRPPTASQILKTRPANLTNKMGQQGQPVKLMTNYFNLKAEDFLVFQWRVDISPDEDRTFVRKQILRQKRSDISPYIFDGTMLFTLKRLSPDPNTPLSFTVVLEDGSQYAVKVKFVAEVQRDDMKFIQVLNIIMANIGDGLKLTKLGRNFYDPMAKSSVPGFNLEVWPGYVTSIRQHERSLLMCVDGSNKILRTDNVLQQMAVVRRNSSNAKTDITKFMLGAIIMTRYNNKTYRVDDVDFNKDPMSTFEHKNKTVTFKDYYEGKYKVRISDLGQPLLISKPRDVDKRRPDIADRPCLLIPELCNMTGLSDEQRSNFKLMKAVGEFTRPEPPRRVATLMKFAARVKNTAESAEALQKWSMELDPDLVRLRGRLLPPEEIIHGGQQGFKYKSDNADWNAMFRTMKMFGQVNCSKWVVIYNSRDEKEVKDFIKAVITSATNFGFLLSGPKPFVIPDTRTSTFVAKLKEVSDLMPQLVMVIIPNNKGDTYSAVKKVTYLEKPTPSQCITATLLRKGKGIMSIASKVAIQMACKLGGEPWGVKIPIKGVMVVGYDTYHDTAEKNKSVGALVSSINDAMTRFTSSCSMHSDTHELHKNIAESLRKALNVYYDVNKAYPKKMIFYRDGVGDGQIETVKETEIAQIKNTMASVMGEEARNMPFAFVIVSKRINTRFFMDNNGRPPTNPFSGTVVDDVVTLPERYDFFLISQSVRQGTVNPTSYNVIEDTSGLRPEHMQMLTYKLTHLYYNWPGTVRVPSVCQYAHKLAYLVGESLHKPPHDALQNLLYYL